MSHDQSSIEPYSAKTSEIDADLETAGLNTSKAKRGRPKKTESSQAAHKPTASKQSQTKSSKANLDASTDPKTPKSKKGGARAKKTPGTDASSTPGTMQKVPSKAAVERAAMAEIDAAISEATLAFEQGSHTETLATPKLLYDKESIYHVLKSRFGFEEFRGKQLEVIQAVLRGKDALVLMETGAGKSLCFALPAVLLPGVTLVVSPLIALMENQVTGYRQKDIAAETLNSTMGAEHRRDIIRRLLADKPDLDMLLVSPEQLATDLFLSVVQLMHKKGNLNFIAIDEAHCISSWGHDFRPAYQGLRSLRRHFPQGVPILALTATASVKVQEDILTTLRLSEPLKICSSFDRPNLSLAVRPVLKEDESISEIAQELKAYNPDGSIPCTIIYALRRTSVDDIAKQLTLRGVPCGAYHAGLKDKERTQVLDDWTAGKLACVAATISFGMGIDKANVRTVYHVNIPKSIEGFYQEAGRAGRDGNPAKSVVYYKKKDEDCMRWIIEEGSKKKRDPAKQSKPPVSELASFNALVDYCTSDSCRRKLLLGYFGEERPHKCGNCDVCISPEEVRRKLAAVLAAFNNESGFGLGRKRGKRSSADAELLDFNLRHPHLDNESSASPESDSEVEEWDSQAGEAAEVAARNKRKGTRAVLDALEEAEAHGKSTDEKRKRPKILKRDGEASAPTRIIVGAPPVSQELRSTAVKRLFGSLATSSLDDNSNARQLHAEQLEQECYAQSGSKAVYLGKIAAAARAAKSQKGAITPLVPGSPPMSASREQVNPEHRRCSMRGAATDPLGVAGENSTDPRQPGMTSGADQINPDLNKLVCELETGDSSAIGVSRMLGVIDQLKMCQVSAALLTRDNIGKRVRKLCKHPSGQIADAARNLVIHWKAMLIAQ